jgi:uncharacterized damage-inducible protein DinB
MADELPTEAPLAGTETETLLGSLERQRAIFAWKCGNIDQAGAQVTIGASSMTLGGLLKHVALVEDTHFATMLLGQEPGPPWNAVDFEADPDWEWRTGAEEDPAAVMALWQQAADRSRAIVARALASGGLDQLGRYKNRDGASPSLRRVLIDMIEEYARHAGHADLIRESVDGLVGEDPPG